MTSMVREISRRYGFSEPTVRRTFQQLRSLGLIRCGFEEKKGLPLRITEIGQLLFAKISKGIELQEVPKLRWKSKYYVIDIS
jgi:DNA-binding IclR family transcriptional regulator